MLLSRFTLGILSFATAVLAAGHAFGQPYPSKPIRILTSPAGGGSDFASRLLAQGLSSGLGQPVIVENRPGSLGPERAAQAQPDGYTLLVDSNSLWLTPLIRKMPYDTLKDFTPVTLAVTAPNVLVVSQSFAANSVKELIALANAKPGTLRYGSSGVGSSLHLASELFKSMAAVNIVHVPYSSGGPAFIYAGLLGDEVQMLIINAVSATPQIKSGKMKALAVTTAQPTPLVPGVPTVAASGLPGYEWAARTGVFAAGQPSRDIVNRLNHEIVRVLNLPDVKEKFLGSGVQTVGNSPQEFTAIVQSEIARMGKVIKDAGIKAD